MNRKQRKQLRKINKKLRKKFKAIWQDDKINVERTYPEIVGD